MSATADRARGGLRRSVSARAARTPLRVKLIAAVLVLVATALGIISIAGLGFLRSYLLSQADGVLLPAFNQHVKQTLRQDVQFYLNNPQLDWPQTRGTVLGWLPSGAASPSWVYLEPTSAPGESLSAAGLPMPTVTPRAGWLTSGGPATVGSASGGARFRMVAVPASYETANGSVLRGTILVGLDVSQDYQTLGRLTITDVALSAVLLIGIGIIGVAMIRTSLRPLTEIEETAEAIAEGDLSRRVPQRDPATEIGRLGRSLNTMLAQIEAAFQARSASEAAARRSEDRMRQFLADASHELRTPLTAIRGFAEYYRQRGGVALPAAGSGPGALDAGPGTEPPRAPVSLPSAGQGAAGQGAAGRGAGGRGPDGQDAAARPGAARWEVAVRPGNGRGRLAPAELDRIMRRLEQESSRMGVLVEDMLLLARLDQQRPLEHRTVDLLTLAADAVHDARVVAPSRAIHLTVGGGQALLVVGDEVRLRQVIGNLMSNAMTHTPDGTPIDVLVRSGRLDEARSPAGGIRVAPGPQPWPGAARPATPGPRLAPASPPDVTGGAPPAAPDTLPQPELTQPELTRPGLPGEPDRPGQAAPSAGPVPYRAVATAAVLEVTDHGPGMTREQAEHAFERFYRADQARTSRGTGLGLAIVAALVAAHGGSVWVDSEPGAGATFRIALPLSPEALHHDGDDDDPALTRREP
jgi:two-component system, OmpR family, sensor kinase